LAVVVVVETLVTALLPVLPVHPVVVQELDHRLKQVDQHLLVLSQGSKVGTCPVVMLVPVVVVSLRWGLTRWELKAGRLVVRGRPHSSQTFRCNFAAGVVVVQVIQPPGRQRSAVVRVKARQETPRTELTTGAAVAVGLKIPALPVTVALGS